MFPPPGQTGQDAGGEEVGRSPVGYVTGTQTQECRVGVILGVKASTHLLQREQAVRLLKQSLGDIFFEGTREGPPQSDEHWNRFKGVVGETSERWGGAHMGFSERIENSPVRHSIV